MSNSLLALLNRKFLMVLNMFARKDTVHYFCIGVLAMSLKT